ncbi:hypothetical protein BT96DRAFT_950723 [Gymnopus androsaceus JB14]|uniref:Uncharacterized protein n=1 Tax=Gymnopus androsaceus JB14 TaxID=1447944 RepID=A0A6A4GFQ3_9AGAR|nr:hypothetical protein BT96DRAFT_950723 [Gymnopus androsaceus JB14]
MKVRDFGLFWRHLWKRLSKGQSAALKISAKSSPNHVRDSRSIAANLFSKAAPGPRMPVLTRAAFKAHRLRFPSFSLEDVLEKDGQVRKDVTEGVEVVDDESVELEDEEDSANLLQQPSPPPAFFYNSSSPPRNSTLPSLSSIPSFEDKQQPVDSFPELHGKERRKAMKNANKPQAREVENELRPRAVENAKNACPNRISDFDSSTLPVASSGWVGNRNGGKLFAGLLSLWRHLALLTDRGFCLLEWDGATCIVLVDAQDCIVAVLAGVPPSAEESGDWANSMSSLEKLWLNNISNKTPNFARHLRRQFSQLRPLILAHRTVTPPHLDAGNIAHGWFPPSATILFPSALITHSNIPVQPSEERRSIVQYSAGGLFRWRYNGWCSDKTFAATASKIERKEWEQDRMH